MSRHEITTREATSPRKNEREPETEVITGSLAYETYPQHQAALIDLLWISPHHRGKKLGTTLIKACLGQLGCTIQVVYLLVSRGNASAMKLYGRLGFFDLQEVQAGPYAVMGYCCRVSNLDETDPKGRRSVPASLTKEERKTMLDLWGRLSASK